VPCSTSSLCPEPMASDGAWGDLAERNPELADQFEGYDHLPEPGGHGVLDAFAARKGITHRSLIRLGARLSDYNVLAVPFSGGVKYRDLISGRRWSTPGATFAKLKIVRSGADTPGTILVAEGESDACWLSDRYPEVDIAVLPAGALNFTEAMAAQLEPYAQVLTALDNDPAGNEGAAKIATHIARAQRFAPPPEATEADWCSLPARLCRRALNRPRPSSSGGSSRPTSTSRPIRPSPIGWSTGPSSAAS
jgi:hypothetical protein